MTLSGFNHSVIISPCLFEAVRQELERRSGAGRKDEETSGGGAESSNHPKYIFHRRVPSFVLVTVAIKRPSRGFDANKTVGVAVFDAGAFGELAGTGYTLGMDSVRFGRALGMGARVAAKTLVTAIDAATAPNPSAGAKIAGGPPAADVAESRSAASGARLGQKAARTTVQVVQTGQGLKRGGKRFGEAVWGPFVRLSGQLWLELTGVFFGIFAVFGCSNLWKMRGDWHETAANHDVHVRLLWSAGMAVVFGYFCASSFVRANRRGKRR